MQAEILRSRPGEVYVHYINTDKRLDEWISEDLVQAHGDQQSNGNDTNGPRKKRKTSRSPSPKPGQSENGEEEVIMMTEKTRTPKGSNLRLPTGYLYWSCLEINQVVVHTMTVDKKSSTASTRLANTDIEDTEMTTAILPTSKSRFAAKLT